MTKPTVTAGSIHGITHTLALGGFYVQTTKTGRRVAVSKKTRRLLTGAG
jgi:hypothetical protein